MFAITQPDKFRPSATWVLSERYTPNRVLQSKQNPTKKEFLKGVYKPRLTLARRPNILGVYEPTLKVELSLPKLLFGNNFHELRYKDFRALVNKLVAVLEQMGVTTTTEHLAQAAISAIHYSKNIPLTDGSTPYHYINKIKEANINLSLDVNQTDYRNEGHSYRWHCNSYEVVFYDKIRDLEKAKTSEKRALEKGNALQLNLFDRLQKRKKFEVLRIEVRLNKRNKIRQLFDKLGIKATLTFKKLFKPAISKKVLLHYINEIESKRPLMLDYQAADDKALLSALIINNPELSPKRIVELYGLKKALEVVTLRELRTMLNVGKRSSANWSRLITSVKNITLPAIKRPFEIIRKQLKKFKPLKLTRPKRQKL